MERQNKPNNQARKKKPEQKFDFLSVGKDETKKTPAKNVYISKQ
jgi:hypothetical protein